MGSQTRRGRKGERGSVLAVSTVGMLAFLLATGLCVDISHLYLVKTELQNAADASALAAASALNNSATGIAAARQRAVAAMNNYEFNHRGVQIPAANVTFAASLGGPYMSEAGAQAQAAQIRFVRVQTAQSAVRIFFASLVLGDNHDLTAEATAGMSVPTNVNCDWIPLTVIDDDVNTITPNHTYTIRAAPQNSVSPGNYQILAISGRGGSDDRIDLASGVDRCAKPGDTVETKPGVTAGAIRQGINTRFDDYQGGTLTPDLYPPDTNIAEGIRYTDYRDQLVTQAPRHPGVAGRRVVVIPIVKISEYNNGRDTVRIDRFGAFFLKSRVQGGNGADIEAEYIGETVMLGRGGYDPNGGPGNDLMVVPVLYR